MVQITTVYDDLLNCRDWTAKPSRSPDIPRHSCLVQYCRPAKATVRQVMDWMGWASPRPSGSFSVTETNTKTAFCFVAKYRPNPNSEKIDHSPTSGWFTDDNDVRCSAASSATLLNSAGERRGVAWRSGQPHVRRYRLTDAVRALAAGGRRPHSGGQSADREEHPPVDGHQRDGHLHVCGHVRSRQHRVRCWGSRQRYGRTRYDQFFVVIVSVILITVAVVVVWCCSLLHPTIYSFLLSDCLLLDFAPSLSLALAYGTIYQSMSSQHRLFSPSEND